MTFPAVADSSEVRSNRRRAQDARAARGERVPSRSVWERGEVSVNEGQCRKARGVASTYIVAALAVIKQSVKVTGE